MIRRDFLKFSLLVAIDFNGKGFMESVNKLTKQKNNYFKILEVEGDYKTIGYQIGKRFKQNFLNVIKNRKEWHQQLIKIQNSKKGKRISNELLRITKNNFPEYVEELKGISEGTGIHFNHIWAMSVKSELLAIEEEPPGCSTISFKNKEQLWLLHNEDGHEAYNNQMFLVNVKPPSGINFISLVYPGTLTGNGPSLNSNGIVQTTNYISSTQAEMGIPRYIIGRAILESQNLKGAQEIATILPRTYPYHHNLGCYKEKKYLSVETIPGKNNIEEPSGLYFHTNHLISNLKNSFTTQDNDYVSSSSNSRFKVIKKNIGEIKNKNIESRMLLDILSLHDKSPYSPCRHPKNKIKGQTLATAFFDINKGIFSLYAGNPCNSVKNKNFKNLSCKIS